MHTNQGAQRNPDRDENPPLGIQDTYDAADDDDLRPSWYLRWRLLDWIVCATLIVGFEALGHFGPVRCRGFRWDDASLGYPYKPNTVPTPALLPIAAGPVLLYTASSLAFPIGAVRGMSAVDEAVALALMQARSIGLNAMMTEPTKLFAGNLRPDFIARLERSGVAPPANPKAFVHLCNVTATEVVEGRKSFPSGHTSTSFAAMVPLALFLVRRIGAFESGHGSTLRLLAGALPIALAFAVGVSRNRDEWHHFVDIVAGAVIGVAAGVISYFLSMQAIPVADRRVRDGSTTADDTPRPFEAPRRAAPLVGPW